MFIVKKNKYVFELFFAGLLTPYRWVMDHH